MAAIDAFRCVRNAPYRVTFPLTNTADALVPTAAGLASFVSVDSAAFASTGGTVTEIGSTGVYYLDLTAAELTATANAAVYVTSSDATDQFVEIPFEPVAESGEAQTAAANTIQLRATAPGADHYYSGMEIEIIRGTGSGQTRTITDYAAGSQTANIDRSWETTPAASSVYAIKGVGNRMGYDSLNGTILANTANAIQINSNTAAASVLALFSEGMALSNSVGDNPTTTQWEPVAGLSLIDDVYNGAIVLFTSGVNTGLCRQIVDYDGDGTPQLINTNAWPAAPAVADKYMIFGKVF